MRHRRPRTRPTARPLLLLVAVVGAAGALLAGDREKARSTASPIRDGRSPTASLSAAAADSVQAFYDSLDAFEARIPAAAVDLKALARQLGSDPHDLLQFVSDSIRYEHYDGVLRGAFGTLISRSGGSCDQAMFLRELLAVHGSASRLRVARADSLTNAALLDRALRQASRDAPEALAPVRDSLASEVEEQLDHLTSIAPDFAVALRTTAEVPRVEHYCWVEADGGGQPVDLDPLAMSGSLSASEAYDDVPDELRFHVALRVLLEKRGDRPDSTVLASTVYATDTLRLDPIRIAILPERGDLLDSLATVTDPLTALQQMESFYPVVALRETAHVEKGFDLAGDVVEPGQEGVLLDAAPLGGGLGDMLAGGMVGAGRDAAEAEPAGARTPLSLRLKYEIRSPGGDVETGERDLGGFEAPLRPEERAGVIASIVTQKQLLVATSAVRGWYLARRFVDFFEDNRPTVEYLARFRGATGEQPPTLQPYPFQLLLLMMAEDGAAQQLNRDGRGVVFRRGPELLVLDQTFERQDTGIARTDAIDIAGQGFEALSADGREKGLRARMGIYSSFLEVHMLGPRAESLLSIVRAAREQGGRSVTLSQREAAELGTLPLPAAQRGAIAAELQAGRIVVVHKRLIDQPGAPDLGWWRLDPVTGDVLAILGNREGGAQQGTEYTLVKATIVGAAVGAAGGYSMCLLTTYQQEGWQGWQGRDGACVVAASCGGLLGAVFAALIFARPIPVYMEIAPPYMAWSGPTQTVVAYLIPSWADIMAGAGLVGGVGGGLWSNLACVIGGSGLPGPSRQPAPSR